jgi:hypothetical protein
LYKHQRVAGWNFFKLLPNLAFGGVPLIVIGEADVLQKLEYCLEKLKRGL